MNEMNRLETQLRSWVPRRPSARLERRLFAAPFSQSMPASPFSWLAPATACFLLALGIISQRPGSAHLASAPPLNAMVTMILSNRSYTACLPESFRQARNHLASFGWTNASRFE